MPGGCLPSLNLLLLPVAGALCGTLVGWSLCIPLSKLRGDYFAAATLILSQAFVLFAANLDSLGGALGFELPTSPMALRNTRPTAWSESLTAHHRLVLYLVRRSSIIQIKPNKHRDSVDFTVRSGTMEARRCGGTSGGIFLPIGGYFQRRCF
jgi:hypothetical protein